MAELMILVAISAATITFTQWCLQPPAPRYRYVQIYHRESDGSITSLGNYSFDLDEPLDKWSGETHPETRYRNLITRLKRQKAEYKVTKPKGFKFNGDPIY